MSQGIDGLVYTINKVGEALAATEGRLAHALEENEALRGRLEVADGRVQELEAQIAEGTPPTSRKAPASAAQKGTP